MSSLARCPTASFPSRSFTASARLTFIGPENPKFVEVPMPPQPYSINKRDIKGTLPVPRKVFPTRGADKTNPEYVAAATREPKGRREPKDDRVAWKYRMSEMRRTNLRQGIVELHNRKLRQDTVTENQTRARRRDRDRRLHAPQREDDRLTSPTITTALKKLRLGYVPDPDREARIAAKAERMKAKEALKEEQRKDALHTLYMNAREFITTEDQLKAEIEKIFVPYPFGEENAGKTNIWDAEGAPPTVQNMLSEVSKTQKTAVDFHRGPAAITGKRMKALAEELTGGKMD